MGVRPIHFVSCYFLIEMYLRSSLRNQRDTFASWETEASSLLIAGVRDQAREQLPP